MAGQRAIVLLTAVLTLGTASQAIASTQAEIGRERAVLRSDGARAIVQMAPYRLVFVDRDGNRVLSEVPNEQVEASELPETEDPEPFTLERDPDNATYVPLGFEIGQEQVARWKSGLWSSNTLFRRRSGMVGSAQEVLRAEGKGEGLDLVLSTNVPGRRIKLRITPDHGAAFRVRARLDNSEGLITFGDSFTVKPDEGFYGFGGRHGSVNKRGEKLYGDVVQENFGGEQTLTGGLALLPLFVEQGTDYSLLELGGAPTPAELPGGYERYLFPNGMNAAYYPQSQFISSRGYGFLLNRSPFSRWRMANDRATAWQVQASSTRLDYTVVLGGSARESVGELSEITGRHRMPPRWAQGATVWRAVQVPPLPGQPPVETADSYRAKIEADLAKIRELDLDLKAYAFEGWALLDDSAYVRSVTKRLRDMGVRSILYNRAFVADDALASQPKGDMQEVVDKGLVTTDAAGEPYTYQTNDGTPGYVLDFTNPDTVRWWRQRLKLLLSLGSDGFMQDFGEQVRDDMHFANGATGVRMHNRYPVLFHRVSRQILDDLQDRRGSREPYWFFTRAGFSGRPGSAAYEMGNFPGDETPDWAGASGLRSLAPDMLNRAVGGAFGYTTDIGGYADFLTGPPSSELFTRWSEWSALTPYFRVHNSATNGTRMPWSYDETTLERWKALAALHDRAVPYIRQLWRTARRTGVPITRPLWLAAPEAPGAATEAQQWMLGGKVLVAPVVEQGASSRSVSFPSGCWERQDAEGRYEGPSVAAVQAPLGQLPYFFRCGTKPF